MRILAIAMISGILLCANVAADAIPVANHSFEDPATDYVTPIVSDWIEIDTDPYSQDTGTFFNNPDLPSYIVNADANQVAYLIAEEGNAFHQELPRVYQVGRYYRMTVGVCISYNSPPPSQPGDPLELAFYYTEANDPNAIDIAVTLIPLADRSNTFLQDFSVEVPAIQEENPCVGKPIGIAIRGRGIAGGAWDLDDVRVNEYPSTPNFTADNIVNLADYATMAAEWLLCGDVITDVTGDGCVNEADLLILAEHWLDNV